MNTQKILERDQVFDDVLVTWIHQWTEKQKYKLYRELQKEIFKDDEE